VDGDLEAGLHGEGVYLSFSQFGEPDGGGIALHGKGAGGGPVGRDRFIEGGSKHFQDFVAVFDLGKLAVDLFAKGDDLGNGLAVLALEAVEEGETVFDFGEALGRGIDSLGLVAEAGADVG
jgi:hypothetical protein